MCYYFDVKYETENELRQILTILSKYGDLIEYEVFEDVKIIRVIESYMLSTRNDEYRFTVMNDIAEEIINTLKAEYVSDLDNNIVTEIEIENIEQSQQVELSNEHNMGYDIDI